MYFDDHEPPHIHVRHAEGAGKIRIDTLEVIDSTLARGISAWSSCGQNSHQDELAENWRRARAGEALNDIEPLR